MLQLLTFMLPLGLAAAVSPVILSEQLVLLIRRHGVPAACAYAAGTATVAALLVAAVIGLGRRLQLPTTPHLDAALDIWLGVGLLVVAAVLLSWRRAHATKPEKKRPSRVRPRAAYGFGLFSMATNVTTLALLLAAAKEISASSVLPLSKLVAAALLVALACLPAWGPVSLVAVTPTASTAVLRKLKVAIDRYGSTVIVVVLAGAGLFLVCRGVYRLEWPADGRTAFDLASVLAMPFID